MSIKIIQPFKPQLVPKRPSGMGLGDMVEKLAKPVAKALKMNCLDPNNDNQLKPDSPCAKRKAKLNEIGKKMGIG